MYTNKLLLSCENDPTNTLQTLNLLLQKEATLYEVQPYLIGSETDIDTLRECIEEQGTQWNAFCNQYLSIDSEIKTRLINTINTAQDIKLPNKHASKSEDEYRQTISTLIFWLSQDMATTLYVTLSDAQPEANYFLSYYLSMYGRKQDHLYAYSNKSNANALVSIPFIVQSCKTATHHTSTTQTDIKQQASMLVVNLTKKSISINNVALDLSPTLFAWYSWLVIRRKTLPDTQSYVYPYSYLHKDFLKHFMLQYGGMHSAYIKVTAAIEKNGFTIDYLSEKRTRINDKIKQAINMNSYDYLIKSYRKPKRPTEYGLALAPSKIRIIK